ncbi:MAG: AAA family ATPase [Lachnospirales bacterium]
MKFDEFIQQVYLLAVNEAKIQEHQILTPEHLLFSILLFNEGITFVYNVGGNVEGIRNDLLTYFKEMVPKSKDGTLLESTNFTFMKSQCVIEAEKRNREKIELLDLFSTFYTLEESYATYYLQKNGVEESRVYKLFGDDFDEVVEGNAVDNEFINKYTINLTLLANRGKLEKVIGRKNEVLRTIEILSRKTKNNPLHIGNAGVGKTSIINLLALEICNGNVPKKFKNASLYSLNVTALLAGTKYRGDFEERTIKLLDELSKVQNCILYIDEIHSIVGTGASENSSNDLAGMLKPYLQEKTIKFIGSTTYDEYRKNFEKDKALNRRFQVQNIYEPSKDEVLEILQGICESFGEYHNVSYSNEILEIIIKFADKYIKDKAFPDKAIDILDEVGTIISVKDLNNKYDIKEKDIMEIFTKMTGQKVVDFDVKENTLLKNLEKHLQKVVFGQDEAIKKVSDNIKVGMLGLKDEEKPICQIMLIGKTGVGKTMITLETAKALNRPIVRFDMSEYQEKHSVARLIGSPQGYVGYEEGGLLIKEVSKNSDCILIFDEIEKAHKDVYNILLQVLDYGVLTENSGKKAYFNNCIIFLTSNIGASEVGKNIIGFGDKKVDTNNMYLNLEKGFTPEFRNRLDTIIVFSDLDSKTAEQIAKTGLVKLKDKLEQKGIELSYSNKVLEVIGNMGLKNDFGGREINRYINDVIKRDIANMIIDKVIPIGSKISIKVKNGNIYIDTK